MFYYLVEKTGNGTRENPFRPDYDGNFVWNPDALCPTCNLYIVGLPEETNLLRPVTDLESASAIRGLAFEDVEKWFVGDNL